MGSNGTTQTTQLSIQTALSENEMKILDAIRNNPRISQSKIAQLNSKWGESAGKLSDTVEKLF